MPVWQKGESNKKATCKSKRGTGVNDKVETGERVTCGTVGVTGISKISRVTIP